MNVVVNGLMTSYQKIGKGQVLVFLPGWGSSSDSFNELVNLFKKNYTCITLDLPGFGGTQTPPNAWSLSDYAEFVADWLAKIGHHNVRALVGHSYGGATAIAGTGKGVLKPEVLVLLASSGIRDTYRVRRLTLKAAAKVVKIPLKLFSSSTQRRVKRKFYGAIGSDSMLLPHMQLTFKRLIGEDLQQTAAKIKIPALLVYGSNDHDTPVKYGRLFHQAIVGSKLETINAGHYLHQEQPETVAELISDFLESN